jgi:hypothetical protein
MTSTCSEHSLFILRRRYTSDTWYIACVLYQLAATGIGVELVSSTLSIMGLYMFQTLLAHPQEALHKRYFVYYVRVMSVGCYQDWSGTGFFDTIYIYLDLHDIYISIHDIYIVY